MARLEKFIDALTEGKKDNLPVPQTRLEKELYEGIVNGGSGGGVSSWNDLTDKPFGEVDGTVIIDADGNLGHHNEFTGTGGIGFQDIINEVVRVYYSGDFGTAHRDVTVMDGGFLNVEDEENNIFFSISNYGPNEYSIGYETNSGSITNLKVVLLESKPLDEKYIPESCKGGGKFIVNVTTDDDGNKVANRSIDEILTAIFSGKVVELHEFDGVTTTVYHLRSYATADSMAGASVTFTMFYVNAHSVASGASYYISSSGVDCYVNNEINEETV